MRKIYTLQLVRAIAAVLVVLFHITGLVFAYHNYNYLNGIFKNGDLGVDLFFVLSGFVIYYVHYKDVRNPLKIKKYIQKRVIRIYPIYWLLLFIIVPIFILVPSFGGGNVLEFRNIIRSVLLIPQNMENLPLTVAWSLSHEILFYIMFGLLIAFKKRLISYIVLVWVILSSLNFLIIHMLWSEQPFLIKFLFSSYNLEFLLGVLVAYIIVNSKLKSGSTFIFVGLVSLIGFAVNEHLGIFGVHRVIGYGLPAAILIYGLVVTEMKKNVKIPKLFLFLGDASYSIYLTHYPMLSLGNKVLMSLNIYQLLGYFLATTILLLMTLVGGCIFHVVIEKRILNFLNSRIFGVTKENPKISYVSVEYTNNK